ncbi:hypothetical protein P9VFCI_008 [Rhizobium phage P9VFCI]|uniref:Uncharacterized protein n=3 Tax=Innesvirus TaxID=3044739 RepID=A0A076YN74_9CAUD|nr:hypothetical protein P10VF_026 [Rhizobium phage vB_RleM_P10VF]YP_010661901.1 hypothetical protein PP937_gp008 [Rhizobium phage P9VFCI]YP_010662209.1 hypothetical protein PP938_gp059 [Rhizobium phage AF3]AIK68239.1 hypothetical protein P10VF_026 [Rhizobium phage vB_RleM_P10VF]QNH71596.1 hypothetical protein AF3_059 [Rhizobium phage AF3]QNH72008.1 hypothetical protein P9VFCI_008 [Rhizobium phage P9VFCI]
MTQYLIMKSSSKRFLHKDVTTDGGVFFHWSASDHGAHIVDSRHEGKELIKEIDPSTSPKDLSFKRY